MTRITGRGAWNAANARRANKPFDDLFTVYPSGSVKILYCDECRTYTNHKQLKSGDWICSCATIHLSACPAQADTPEIENGVSSPEWFEQQKVEPF